MYARHGDNAQYGSNRYHYRDLADLLLISQQGTVPGQAVTQALHREAERRRSNGTVLELPVAFKTPGSDWDDGYPEQAALVVGLQGCGTYAEAAQAAAAFTNPMLDRTAQGTWDPRKAAWA